MPLDSPIKRALMVVAKQPAPGQTKTRLSPPLTGAQAADLYACFLSDTLDLIRRVRAMIDFQPILVYLPENASSYFHTLAPDFDLQLQQGANLSERLNHATTHCLMTGGYEQVVIMDSDSPTLPVECLYQAFTALEDADISLGPCDDGGYYLIGLKRPAPPLFLQVTMSTPHVVADTLARAQVEKLTVATLPTCYDIDFLNDVQRLAEELLTLPPEIAAHTRAFLTAHPGLLSVDEDQ
ncbi:MAG: TIGR04282 family arsenosugar biosynthesis glycosyltransferase [Aggregatilineales bacterium]